MLRHVTCLAATLVLAQPAAAETDAGTLYAALRLDDIIAVMREEGIEYGIELEEGLFPGEGGRSWERSVAAIYDVDAMQERIAADFADELGQTDLAPLFDFFNAPEGREIVALEVEARRALREEVVETAARERAVEMRETDDPRMDRIEAFVDANDLIEENVVGALNSNYAFYRGMIEGGAFEEEMSQDQILGDVWAQEADIRADTTAWIYGYLALAYQPLADADFDAYIALSRTTEGRAMNDALFAAFDELYVAISERLGAEAARFMTGRDI